MNFKDFKDLIVKKNLDEKTKEFFCHIQFVQKIALNLARQKKANLQIIEIAALLHDIGRGSELENEDHGDAGARIAKELLEISNFTDKEKNQIISAIKKHNKKSLNLTLEEKIIITADSASKIIYHEAFMLMCKKPTHLEKLVWGMKYLEKGYQGIKFSDFKALLKPKYKELKNIYNAVLAK